MQPEAVEAGGGNSIHIRHGRISLAKERSGSTVTPRKALSRR
ncbi:hypothetical protein PATSB16_06030 [Pandoraea thiooxydans]|nr:hypothetical protein PATSB16_06030 [Pandoraea thiooxydans]